MVLIVVDLRNPGACRPCGGHGGDPLADLAGAVAGRGFHLRVCPTVQRPQIFGSDRGEELLVPFGIEALVDELAGGHRAGKGKHHLAYVCHPPVHTDIALGAAMDDEVADAFIGRRVILREHHPRFMRQAARAQEGHPLAEPGREAPDRLAQQAAPAEAGSRMAQGVEMDRQHGPGVEGAHEVVQHVAEAVIDGHRIGRRDVELFGDQPLGAGDGDVRGDVEASGEAADVVERLRLLDDGEGRHQLQVQPVVVVRPKHHHQLRIKGAELLHPALVALPEARRQATVLGLEERHVRNTGDVGSGGRSRIEVFHSGRSPCGWFPRAKAGASGPAKTEVALRRWNSQTPFVRTHTSSKSPIDGVVAATGRGP